MRHMTTGKTAKRALVVQILAALVVISGAALTCARSEPLTEGELRPLYAMAVDLAEGKELAAATCAKCHGLDGAAIDKGAPHLAGQRPSYLYRKLKQYQGLRHPNAEMAEKVKFLSDDAIVKVSAYYASLDPVPPPADAAPPFVDAVAAGKAASASCAKCHGENFISEKPGVPNLIGFDPKYLVEAMKAYKSRDRNVGGKNEQMMASLDAMSDKDLANIALYLGLQDNFPGAKTPLAGDPVTKDTLAACVKCHGEDGVGTSAATPSIAGQDATYMLNALASYKDGSRDDDTMSSRARKLADKDRDALVAYYASLPPKAPNIVRPLTTEQWAEKCDHCHGVNGNSARPDVPALAGQRMDYMVAVMRAYRSGERPNPEMLAMASVLSDDDIAGIAAHYAYQKARSAVFVLVPK